MEVKNKKTLAKKVEHWYIYTTSMFVLFSCMLFAFWLIFPLKVNTTQSPVIVDKQVYRPGDRITYTLSYCKYKNMPGTVYRSLVNSTRTTFTAISGSLPTGCHMIRVSDLVIPDYTDDGLYHIEGYTEYKVNPIRTIKSSWQTEEFMIVK